MTRITEAQARELFGDPSETRRRLRRFADAARAVAADHERLVDEYPEQWVAVVDGQVRAHADDLTTLLQELEAAEIQSDEAIIRFLERDPRPLIL